MLKSQWKRPVVVMPHTVRTDSDFEELAGTRKFQANKMAEQAVKIASRVMTPLEQLSVEIERYFLSFVECEHGNKAQTCYACNTDVKNNPKLWGFNPNMSMEYNQTLLDEFLAEQAEKLRKLRTFFARNKPQHSDPTAYLPASEASTVTAQSFSRRPLRFGGNDRVLSDQHKFGSRSERASQKHHVETKNGRELHKYYGHNERVWNPKHNRYDSAPDNSITKVPRGDHYMER